MKIHEMPDKPGQSDPGNPIVFSRQPLLRALAVIVLLFQGIPAFAQTFSLEAVGFVNVEVPPGMSQAANPLFTWDNRVPGVLPNSLGLPDGLQIFKVDSVGAFAVNRYSSATGWSDTNMTIYPGEGFMIRNPAPTNFVITFTGVVAQGGLNVDLPQGLSLCSSVVPEAGLITQDLGFPATAGDSVIIFDNPTGAYKVFTYSTGGWSPQEPVIAVGESFFASKVAATNWTRLFNVNDFGYLGGPPIAGGWFLDLWAAAGGMDATNYPFALSPSFGTTAFTLQPGSTAVLNSGALTNLPTTFQWQFNGTNLFDTFGVSGAGTATLTLSGIDQTSAGIYSVVTSNALAFGAHAGAELTVITSPANNQQKVQRGQGFSQLINVQPMQSYRIETSGDLVNWSAWTNFSSTTRLFKLSDPGSVNQMARFYRFSAP